MTQNHLQTIEEYVKKSNGPVILRLTDGVLRDRLIGTALDGMPDEETDSDAMDQDLEIQLRLAHSDSTTQLSFSLLTGTAHSGECAVSTLDEKALEDLVEYLSRLGEASRPPRGAGRMVIKRKGEPDSYDKMGASSRLKVSPEWLKRIIPCSNYRYEEIDGRKIIHEYYWSVEFIENLFRIKNSKITPDDLRYVADQCCFGDMDWAKDLISRLKSPNRAEPTPREQPAKSQQKQNRPFSRDRMSGRHRGKNQPKAQ